MPGFFYRPVRFSADHLTNSACSWVFNKLVEAAMSIFWLVPTSHVAYRREWPACRRVRVVARAYR